MAVTFLKNLFGKSEEPVSGASLKKILSATLTPQLLQLGLSKSDGNYWWFSDFNQEGIRKAFKYTLMKGDTGLFSWGVCIRHIPTVTSSKRLQYHKSEKSIAFHLWEWPAGYSISLEKDLLPGDLVSHANARECRQSLQEIFTKYRVEIENWYKRADTLTGCIGIADDQNEKGGVYRMRWPTGNYVKIFLLALNGDKQKAKDLLARASAPAARGSSDWKSLAATLEKEIDRI
jgi:hypothetical protein